MTTFENLPQYLQKLAILYDKLPTEINELPDEVWENLPGKTPSQKIAEYYRRKSSQHSGLVKNDEERTREYFYRYDPEQLMLMDLYGNDPRKAALILARIQDGTIDPESLYVANIMEA